MVETHDIREGARVAGSHGERFGVVDGITRDGNDGVPTGFVIKTGFWPLQKRKTLSISCIRQINNDPDTIIINVSKTEFRGMPSLKD